MASTLLERPAATTRPRVRARVPALKLGALGAVAVVLAVGPRLPGAAGQRLTEVSLAFVALLAESMPFLLAGAVLASLLRGRAGRRLIAAAVRRPALAAVVAPLSGVALPLCDCGLVPVARRLGAGGASSAVVNGFVAGAPLTNPIVILSTVVAFPGSPGMVVGRIGVGLGVAMLAAWLSPAPTCSSHDDHDDGRPPVAQALSEELARTAPVLVVGALAAGAIKGLLPADLFGALDAQPLIGAVVMMGLAFVMSICSQADAFVAASLPVGSLGRLAFLVLGPMLDLRLASLYRREFGGRWLVGYAAVVVPSVLVLSTAWVTWGIA